MLRVLTVILTLAAALPAAADSPTWTVQKRSRVRLSDGSFALQIKPEVWQPRETALIVCDMWDSHHCLNAVRRCVEMAPRMNEVLARARQAGALIIHAPSGCMEAYRDHPGRQIARQAPPAPDLPPDIGQWCSQIPSEEQAIYPLDQKEGGEDDDPADHERWHALLAALGRNPKAPWKAQTPLLTIAPGDAISDSGVEIWNLLHARGIRHVVLLGVHTNMCVLGRPFGLRQMARHGKDVVLLRDLTDTMYDPARWPYVSHFAGTDLIIEHIEKYVCPTIASPDLAGGQAFRFARDKRRVLMLIGDDEYKTEWTLPEFAARDLAPLGFEVTILHSDLNDKNLFPGMAEAIRQADVVLVSVRRRLPPKADLDALREHVAQGKPVVGIRTACHAWCLRDAKQNEAAAAAGRGVWPQFDPEVFGGNYTNHYGEGPPTEISLAPQAHEHPILRGVDVGQLVGFGSLYKVRPLAGTTTPLLLGTIPQQPPEPVAWTNRAGPRQARVFNTTLGHPRDFTQPAFRKLLVNALFWALEEPYPTGQPLEALLPTAQP
jgi:nicotinamidase-related amidase